MIAASLLCLVPLAAPVDAEAEAVATLEMKPVEVRLPGGGTATAYRGMLRVPVVRANPESKLIGVDVWRFPAVDGGDGAPEGRPPVFRLNGGPGWPGFEPDRIDWAEEVAPTIAHTDLVVVGQRGIGTSEPDTSCDAFAAPIDPDLPREERAAAARAQSAACRAHWEEQGYDLSGFNVLEAAADVDDVRRLLGYEKIVLIGGSFGSHWGMAIMRLHPGIVARAVLHGLEGPDHTWDSPAGLLAALERIAAEAEAAPELEGQLPYEGLIHCLREAIGRLEAEPVEVEVDGRTVTLDGDALRELALGVTANVGSRRSVGGWPADVMRLFVGAYEDAARATLERLDEAPGMPTASFFALDCGSGITAERRARYAGSDAVEIVGDPNWYYQAACPAWGVDLGDDFRGTFTTSIPTLIVHGTWDTSTPFENALELLPCFEDLHFVPVEGGTHGALGEAIRNDPSFLAAFEAFLFEGKTDDLPDAIELPPIAWRTGW